MSMCLYTKYGHNVVFFSVTDENIKTSISGQNLELSWAVFLLFFLSWQWTSCSEVSDSEVALNGVTAKPEIMELRTMAWPGSSSCVGQQYRNVLYFHSYVQKYAWQERKPESSNYCFRKLSSFHNLQWFYFEEAFETGNRVWKGFFVYCKKYQRVLC